MSDTLTGVSERSGQQAGRRQPRLAFEGRLMAPGVILLAALSIVPFLAIIWMNFSQVRLLGGVATSWVGFDNWARFFTDVDMAANWLRTFAFFILTVGLEMLGGVVLALCLWRVMRGRNLVL